MWEATRLWRMGDKGRGRSGRSIDRAGQDPMLMLRIVKAWRVLCNNHYNFTFMPVLPERMPPWSEPSQVLRTAAAWSKPTRPRVRTHGPAGQWAASAVSGGSSTRQRSSLSRIISSHFARSGFVLRLKVVVLTGSPLDDQKRLGDFCHAHGIQFVVADTKGLCGWVWKTWRSRLEQTNNPDPIETCDLFLDSCSVTLGRSLRSWTGTRRL